MQVHVVPAGDAWHVKHEGSDEVIAEASTQAEAERLAKEHARQHGYAEVITHGTGGRITGSDTMDRAHEGKGHDANR
jgi:hypothetical protein